jgi:uncharacterized protein (TIGR04255 family)
LTEERRIAGAYNNPPLVEAVCEFRLAQDARFNADIPDLIYGKIREAFPIQAIHKVTEVKIETSGEQADETKTTTQEHNAVRFFNTDKNKLIHVDPVARLIAAVCLRPYPSWEVFRPLIEDVFNLLVEFTGTEPFQRLGLRYTNRIEILSAGKKSSLEEYFQFRPCPMRGTLPDIKSFVVGYVLPFAQERDLCRVQLTDSVPTRVDYDAFMLDLDYFLARPQTIPINDSLEWVDGAHDAINRIFESCITDSLRKIFQEIQ